MTSAPYHQKVAENILEQLKQGQAPWVKPWNEGSQHFVPYNPISKKRYKGINALYLMLNSHDDNRWITYKQAQSLGAQVRRGEKGTQVQYWKFTEDKIKRDEKNSPVLDDNGDAIKITVRLERPKVFYATVFNASQVDNMPELVKKKRTWNAVAKAEDILKESGALIHHTETDAAFYKPSTDSIHLPQQDQFKSSSHYYATALHELGHWTGHETRLNRDINNPFGSEAYAREELRAEIASMLLGDEIGLGHDPSQHSAYIKSWIKILEEEPLEIFRAAADAEKIVTHITSLSHTLKADITSNEETKDEIKQEETLMKTPLSDKRVWLNIPFHEKDTVKELAGKLEDGSNAIAWDKDAKKWYAKDGADLEVLNHWLVSIKKVSEDKDKSEELLTEKTWLAVPYKQKEVAKSSIGRLPDGTHGLAWDKNQKCWYAKSGISKEKIKPWIPERAEIKQEPALNSQEEFKEALLELGAVITADHPLMDGQPHRISADGDKSGEKAIFYVGHLDGIPAGYIKNNRTGAELKWKSKGYVLSDEQKMHFKATALEKQKSREAELIKKHKNTAVRLQKKLSHMQEINKATPYIESKGINVHSGIYTDEKNQITCVPATDVNGDIWSMQYILEDGTKRFAKDSRKEGCFHVLGGIGKLSDSPVIIISEGYATAATIKEATDIPAVVSSFDAGNLKPVAQALHEKYPDKPIIIAGDDDRYLEHETGSNTGKNKAKEAAKEVNGIYVLPVFSPGEQINNPKKFTDFNDLAKHSSLGIKAVKRQLKPRIRKACKRVGVLNKVIHSRIKRSA